jgi:hypothetical protein
MRGCGGRKECLRDQELIALRNPERVCKCGCMCVRINACICKCRFLYCHYVAEDHCGGSLSRK